MKSPDENPLLREILTDERLAEFRQNSLERALMEMRHSRRRRRFARNAATVILPLALLALVWLTFSTPHPTTQPTALEHGVPAVAGADARDALAQASATEARAPSTVETITDEELFALFPNRALALIGSPGRQQLVFLDAPMAN